MEGRGAQVGHVGYLVLGVVARARALAAGGDWPAAQQALEEARQVLRERAVGNALAQVVDAAVVEVAVESSDRDRANRALGEDSRRAGLGSAWRSGWRGWVVP